MKRDQKKRIIEERLVGVGGGLVLVLVGGGARGEWRGVTAARVSASTGLVHYRQGPPALPPLLSAGSVARKK